MREGDRVQVYLGSKKRGWVYVPMFKVGTLIALRGESVQVLIDDGATLFVPAKDAWRLLDYPLEVTRLEIQMALEGNQAPAANADEWETEMLNKLAEFDRLKGVR